jgi:hypothetical protein
MVSFVTELTVLVHPSWRITDPFAKRQGRVSSIVFDLRVTFVAIPLKLLNWPISRLRKVGKARRMVCALLNFMLMVVKLACEMERAHTMAQPDIIATGLTSGYKIKSIRNALEHT